MYGQGREGEKGKKGVQSQTNGLQGPQIGGLRAVTPFGAGLEVDQGQKGRQKDQILIIFTHRHPCCCRRNRKKKERAIKTSWQRGERDNGGRNNKSAQGDQSIKVFDTGVLNNRY